MVGKRIENRNDRGGGRYGLRLHSDESMELAGPNGVRRARDHFWASVGPSGPQQDPVRRISREARLWRTLEAPDERPLGTDDSRGTRKIPPRHGRPLWSRRFGSGGGT